MFQGIHHSQETLICAVREAQQPQTADSFYSYTSDPLLEECLFRSSPHDAPHPQREISILSDSTRTTPALQVDILAITTLDLEMREQSKDPHITCAKHK